ncbi:MAG: BatA domain-containing protein [bacterium]|nr:BatA domain-containing protein [bacterium]
MTWLNPTILGFAAAAGVPLLLYLLSRRRLPKIYFSTLRFLKAIEKKQHRRLKITQWLLILLRILAILCIVTAFARPLTVGVLPGGSPANAEVAIVLDRSASMMATAPSGSPFDQAVRSIKQLLTTLAPQDRVSLFFADEIDSHIALSSIDAIQSALDGESPKPVSDDLTNGLVRAERALSESPAPFRSLLLFTDGIGNDDTTLAVAKPGISYLRWSPPDLSQSNRAIVSLQQLEPLLDQTNGVLVAATIKSFAKSSSEATVRVSVGSFGTTLDAIGEQTVELAPGAERSVEWIVKPQGNGPWLVRAELLQDDELSFDNRSELLIPATEPSRITVSGDPAAVEILTRTYRVLSIPVAPSSNQTGLTIHAGRFPPTQSPEQWKSRLQTGERLWLIPAQNADAAMWNRWISAISSLQLKTFDYAQRGKYSLRKNELAAYLRGWVKAPEASVSGRWQVAAENSVLHFDDGNPVWCDLVIGNGKLRLDAIPVADVGWETEPVRIPLLARGYATMQSIEPQPVLEAGVGREIPTKLVGLQRAISPNGKVTIPEQNRVDLLETGIWSADGTQHFVVKIPSQESNREVRRRFGGISDSTFRMLPGEAKVFASAWQQTRSGREWRSVLLITAILLLLVEGYLGRGRRESN